MATSKSKEVDTREGDDGQDEGPKQRVTRMPPEAEVGPFFPSGMSAPEAGMAGAVANLSDEDKEKLAKEAKMLGMDDAALVASGRDVDDDDDE